MNRFLNDNLIPDITELIKDYAYDFKKEFSKSLKVIGDPEIKRITDTINEGVQSGMYISPYTDEKYIPYFIKNYNPYRFRYLKEVADKKDGDIVLAVQQRSATDTKSARVGFADLGIDIWVGCFTWDGKKFAPERYRKYSF